MRLSLLFIYKRNEHSLAYAAGIGLNKSREKMKSYLEKVLPGRQPIRERNITE